MGREKTNDVRVAELREFRQKARSEALYSGNRGEIGGMKSGLKRGAFLTVAIIKRLAEIKNKETGIKHGCGELGGGHKGPITYVMKVGYRCAAHQRTGY